MEMNHHEEPAVASRLYFLKDAEASMRYVHSNIYQTFEAPDDMKAAGFPIPGKIEQYSSFVSQYRQFLLIGAPVQWVFIKLRLDGASIAYLDDYKEAKPYTDTVLYLVTMPSKTVPGFSTKVRLVNPTRSPDWHQVSRHEGWQNSRRPQFLSCPQTP